MNKNVFLANKPSGGTELQSLKPDQINRSKLLRRKSSDVLRINVEQLEIDRTEKPFGFFPLLDMNIEYLADTMDLTKDLEARDYWLTCFQGIYEIIIKIKLLLQCMYLNQVGSSE